MMHWYLGLFSIIFARLGSGIDQDIPCFNDSWVYSPISGKCYKQMANREKLSWNEASKQCESFLKDFSAVPVRLVQFKTKEEGLTLARIMQTAGFRETIWLGAKREVGEAFKWQGESEPANFFFDWSGGAGNGDCMEFSYETNSSEDAGKWELQVKVENTDCNSLRAYYCEHKVLRCENPPGGFNEETMRFEPDAAFPGMVLRAVCDRGKFMVKDEITSFMDGPDVNTSLTKDHYYCTGRRANEGNADPLKFQTRFKYSGYSVTKCETLKCLLFPEGLEHVDNRPEPDPGEAYLTKRFGEVIDLNCSHGYVSQENRSSTEATMRCGQGDISSTEGMWIPENYQACVAVRCSESQLLDMKPENAILASARNHDTDKVYGSHQVNEFNYFGNVITYRCQPGFLYPDRAVEKEVICDLKEGSEKDGQYYGYSGTVLPLPAKCEVTTCMYENAKLKPEYNMQSYFLANNATGIWKNLTKHDGKMYALNAELRFFCKPGYETVNQNEDLNISCSNSGNWVPQLIGCIEIAEDIPASSDGRFQGTKEEAKSAKEVSSIMLILIIIFLAFIVIMDLTTVGRDAKTLVRNVKLQKKRILMAKQKSQRRQAGDTITYNSTDSDLQVRNRFE